MLVEAVRVSGPNLWCQPCHDSLAPEALLPRPAPRAAGAGRVIHSNRRGRFSRHPGPHFIGRGEPRSESVKIIPESRSESVRVGPSRSNILWAGPGDTITMA